ncbi:hypothetical protein F5Y14DRAFT_134571 [Nemania sp. NC0429]|nr:hypothetical protein F5Y14DRAFT_134571 [Nemania sp. NC0429]
MENPEAEISGVIRSLTTGTRNEQEDALNEFFLPDAYFVHPFCRVPSFGSTQIRVPFTNINWMVNSRLLISFVYQWYKIMSPKITLQVDSTSFDKQTNSLYATIRQTFTVWILPFSLWQANVKLVCLLDLVHAEVDDNQQLLDLGNGTAETHGNSQVTVAPKKKLYFIRGQQDHYQLDDMLKFIAPFGGSALCHVWQLFATVLCIIGTAILWPVTSIYERGGFVKSTRDGKKYAPKDY